LRGNYDARYPWTARAQRAIVLPIEPRNGLDRLYG
jgi:hypothetical protein